MCQKKDYNSVPLAYYCINITKWNQKIISHSGGMSSGCHLMAQCQKHVKIHCGKIQITYMYKITFIILMALTVGI